MKNIILIAAILGASTLAAYSQQATLLQPTAFPIVINGQAVGSTTVPKGAVVSVVKQDAGKVEVSYNGMTANVPAASVSIPKPVATPVPTATPVAASTPTPTPPKSKNVIVAIDIMENAPAIDALRKAGFNVTVVNADYLMAKPRTLVPGWSMEFPNDVSQYSALVCLGPDPKKYPQAKEAGLLIVHDSGNQLPQPVRPTNDHKFVIKKTGDKDYTFAYAQYDCQHKAVDPQTHLPVDPDPNRFNSLIDILQAGQ